jgi:tetratricopeptide (TPR) repeat protein
MSDRIAQLRKHLESNPRDPFLRYAIAIELKGSGALEEALSVFEELQRSDPDYVPTYYHLGQTLEALDRSDEAGAVYRAGIEAAKKQGNGHAAAELQAAADILGA